MLTQDQLHPIAEFKSQTMGFVQGRDRVSMAVPYNGAASAPVSLRRHAVICLGHSLMDGGRVPKLLELRVAHAAALFNRLSSQPGGACLYVSGADVKGRGKLKSEGQVMFELLQQQGIHKADIDVDTQAFNTVENAKNAIAPLRARGVEEAVLVTSDFHSPRAHYIFKTVFAGEGIVDIAMTVDPAPSGLAAGAARPNPPNEINDWNFFERIEHETALLERQMVSWLDSYGYKSCKSDFDEALSLLRDLAHLVLSSGSSG